jgi:hypothetical protein
VNTGLFETYQAKKGFMRAQPLRAAQTFPAAILVTFTLVNCALITITLREANLRNARVALSAPIIIPLISAISSIGLMVISLA